MNIAKIEMIIENFLKNISFLIDCYTCYEISYSRTLNNILEKTALTDDLENEWSELKTCFSS